MSGDTRGVVHTDSRWWYWVAALPAIVALWLASALWVLLGVSLGFGGLGGGAGGGGGSGGLGGQGLLFLPAVALGAPALVVFFLLPLALWRDGDAVRRSGAGWPDLPVVWAAVAGVVDVVLLAGLVVLARIDRTLGLAVVLLAVLAGTALAITYLRRRARHVWTPTSLWELKRELQPR